MAWLCYKHYAVCHDGQSGFALLILVPLCVLSGSVLSLAWTWLSLRIPRHKVWASIFSYAGPNRH